MAPRDHQDPGVRRARRAVPLLLIGAALLLAVPVPAQAHGGLTSADPAPRSRLTRPPQQVQLQFGQPSVPDPRTRVHVFSPSGVDLAEGPAAAGGLGVSQRVAAATEPGVYTVAYTVVAVDGHVSTGWYRFRFRPPPGTRPGGDAAQALWWGGAGFAVVGAALVGLTRRRRAVAEPLGPSGG